MEKHIPTPTYKGILLAAYLDVIRAKNIKDYSHCLECLETLRDILTPPMRAELKGAWVKFDLAAQKIAGLNSFDVTSTLQLRHSHMKILVENYVSPLLREITDVLHRHKYLDDTWGTKPDSKGGSFGF